MTRLFDELKDFSSPTKGAKITDEAYARAAHRLGLNTDREIRAVAKVESAGAGFQNWGGGVFPTILYEPHWFGRLTNHQWDELTKDGHPISTRDSRNNRYPKSQIARYFCLIYAAGFDEVAALKSASWGSFQIMGFNYADLGYKDVYGFVKDMIISEDYHLQAFVSFILKNKLDDEIRNHDWVGFAKRYNGPDYAKNMYDKALERAYDGMVNYRVANAHDDGLDRLIGLKNDKVLTLQKALNFVMKAGLVEDGEVGPRTLRAIRESLHRGTLSMSNVELLTS